MNRELVLGLAIDLGSRTSHTAIMARSLNIPAVVGLHDITETLETGQEVLIDGHNGLLIVYGKRSHLFYNGPVANHDFKNFELSVDIATLQKANSGVYIHTE